MALPLVGVGLLYRNGYFRQTIDADGHQEHRYPDYDLASPAADPRARPRRRPADRVGRAARPRRPGRRLDGAGRPRAGPAARHRHPGQRSGRPADHAHPVRPRPRDAPPPGARPGRRRRARAAGARRSSRPCGTSTRATRRSCSPSGPASSSPPAPRSTTRSGRWRATRVFTIHTPVSAGNERFDVDLVRRIAGPLLDGDGRPEHGRRAGRARCSRSGAARTATTASST